MWKLRRSRLPHHWPTATYPCDSRTPRGGHGCVTLNGHLSASFEMYNKCKKVRDNALGVGLRYCIVFIQPGSVTEDKQALSVLFRPVCWKLGFSVRGRPRYVSLDAGCMELIEYVMLTPRHVFSTSRSTVMHDGCALVLICTGSVCYAHKGVLRGMLSNRNAAYICTHVALKRCGELKKTCKGPVPVTLSFTLDSVQCQTLFLKVVLS